VGLKVFAPAKEEPLTLAEAREHLRPSHALEDALILRLIAAARAHAEAFMERRLITQTWDYTLDTFPYAPWYMTRDYCKPYALEIPLPPLQSVESVTYVDGAGAPILVDPLNYTVDTIAEPGRIAPASGTYWPSPRVQMNAITIRFVCGYGLAGAVPEEIKQALLLLVGHWYEHREEVSEVELYKVPMACESLLSPYKILRL
jgi:uncharacterized phiE125 gp8 family phage protein